MSKNIKNIKLAIDYIEEHLAEPLNLSIVANAVHYSKYHLHRLFTSVVGMTMHDYIQRRKLTEAAKLLVFSDQSILEIAWIAGYESQQAFTTIFKEMYKKSPNQFRENEVYYPLQLKFMLHEHLVSTAEPELEDYIKFAEPEDMEIWMDLVRLVVDGFPCLIEEDYMRILNECIQEKRALILKKEAIAIGIMIFSYDTASIDFLGIHPQYQKLGIAKAFLNKVTRDICRGKEISITTFREGDKADTGYREIYKRLGFTEAEFLEEYGYPTQKFIFQSQVRRGNR
ncbi:GNAT family N-acetyltransferase [Sinanaerobacter sp. ZZT-01]|uniref:GNAT family N-acetyltransferase n=1 Tax=Sinanaerobacter sp. ZZT-01 TaxID=3111540 RepID=UPI002D7661AA|nr:GNAT family N-acetyltransferase [Sinanaerobacter sp. ZZT-01]WRR93634.1 GNAT family N-acetyltransferase [Sinanaerobacter sp. ZZT-01]